MHVLSDRSEGRLDTVDVHLAAVVRRAIRQGPIDFTVVWGFRGHSQQNAAHAAGHSKKRWPDSPHNRTPSHAVDLAPILPDGSIPWNDHRYWYFMAGWVLSSAEQLSIPVGWGGNWDGDGTFGDQTFNDLGHFEREPWKRTERISA